MSHNELKVPLVQTRFPQRDCFCKANACLSLFTIIFGFSCPPAGDGPPAGPPDSPGTKRMQEVELTFIQRKAAASACLGVFCGRTFQNSVPVLKLALKGNSDHKAAFWHISSLFILRKVNLAICVSHYLMSMDLLDSAAQAK